MLSTNQMILLFIGAGVFAIALGMTVAVIIFGSEHNEWVKTRGKKWIKKHPHLNLNNKPNVGIIIIICMLYVSAIVLFLSMLLI